MQNHISQDPPPNYVNDYLEQGFAIIRHVFSPADIQKLKQALDLLEIQAQAYERSYRHQNLLYLIQNDPQEGKILRFVQWPAYQNDILAGYRTDLRLYKILAPLLGENMKQIINQASWKPPHSQASTYGFHQDARFRRPKSAYRDLANSFIQTALAIDPHRKDNGCLKVIAKSHLLGEIHQEFKESVYLQTCSEAVLKDWGLEDYQIIDIELEPGDLALWHPYTVHGSGPNCSNDNRRTYLNGYVKASHCDRGEWAFKNGQPQALGEPVLVQYEALYSRPEPHYIEGPPHPFAQEAS